MSEAEDLANDLKALGPKRVKTPNMEIEMHDPIRAQQAIERAQAEHPTFGNFNITIASPLLPKYRRRPN